MRLAVQTLPLCPCTGHMPRQHTRAHASRSAKQQNGGHKLLPCLRDWFKRVRGRIFYQNRRLCLSFGGRKLFSAQSPARANPENRAVYRCNLILSRARGIILVDITAGLGDTVRKQNRKQTDIVRNVFCRRISVQSRVFRETVRYKTQIQVDLSRPENGGTYA